MKNLAQFLSALLLSLTLASAQTIGVGAYHSFTICKDKTVQSWGANYLGALGNGSNTSSNIPVPVSSLTDIAAVTGGWNHSLALKNDSTVWAWGWNVNGQLGNGTNTDSNIPIQISSLSGIVSITGKHKSSLALKNDGTVWAWGRNYNGQLGNGTNIDSNVPVQVSFLTGINDIGGGEGHSFAIKDDGTVWAWGYNFDGQLGNGTSISSNVPVLVSSLTSITAITGGTEYYSLALKSDGTVWAWGNNDWGQLGNGSNVSSNIPVPVSSLTGITAIAAGAANSLALKNDGTVWAWGDVINGNVPVPLSFLTDITAIASGRNYFLALKNDNTVWAWGDNANGQLGNGTNTASNVPVQVIELCQLTTAINEIVEKEAGMNVFPNPACNAITININTSKSNEAFTLKVRDFLSKTVYSETIKEISGPYTKQVDLSFLPKGIYFIELQSSSPDYLQRSEVKKIVLQ